ncbi:DUF4435 domain-containing protein [Aquimarina sp. 2201CG5-10]|uniref:DUF4435 domain-containing protein n=1 Tax=Aquimarina callyspongiae TaxID=3098150 RepID=UPI002AB43B1E|nr:DUF4435 domain-containing protein [Aquimarina sp. 2201CG5-10]MDY8137288.1 DUF4435 domain-containing protein [Aquimarina sp. 2201CG5-10]
MEFLDYLKNAAKSSTSVYAKFLQQYNFGNNGIHVFYEGKDDPSFYSNYIERYKGKKQRIFYYRAQNKKSVYHNYSQVDWSQYKKNRVLFLVDKDFRDILNETYPTDTNIFETKYYSIENYLVNKSMFARCLRELLSIDDDKVINQITREFIIQLTNFHKEIMPVIALILYFRENKLNANLNQIDLSQVFEFKEKVKRKRSIKEFLEKSMDTPNGAPWKDVLTHSRTLSEIDNSKYYVRGKFEMWFFLKFLNSLPDILNCDRKKGEPKFKLNVNLSAATAVQVLAPRLRIPKELKEFLDNNLKKSA